MVAVMGGTECKRHCTTPHGGVLLQASTSVQHLVLPSHWSQRNQMLPDLVRCYGACGRTIIFTETKKDANELTNVLSETCGARALHGDIPQVRRVPSNDALRGMWM